MVDRSLSVVSSRSIANIGKKLRDHDHVESQGDSLKKTNIIIGIDYGTSFSGAAYALYTRRPREPHVTTISDWPHAHPHHRSSQKVPSDLSYDEQGNTHCGFDIPEDCEKLKWVKLLLETDPSEKHALLLQSEEVENTRRALLRFGKTPIQAVADYLEWLWTTICETIAEEQNDSDLLANSNVTVMMTVPAMWSEAAKENTFQAAERAGISSDDRVLKFITEPEAAAIAELQIRISNGQLEDGDCVIVCDAGGGTVDLVSYRVRTIEPMELDQVVVADGGLCGSSYIDQAFLNQVKSMMQSDWEKLSAASKDELRDRFAFSIKPAFDGVKGRKEVIHLHSEEEPFEHIINGRLIIEPQVVRVAFETVVPQILSLVDEQEMALEDQGLRSKLKGVLLVGGLGSSRFIHSRIEQNYSREDQVKVWRGRHSWSSVVEGAVKCAFMNLGNIYQITTRLSRFNYGIPFHPPWDSSTHRLEDQFICPYERTPKARLIQWLVRKGQEVKPGDEPQIFDFTKIVSYVNPSVSEEDKVYTGFSLLQSGEENAPNYFTPAVKDFVKVECYFSTTILRGSWHRQYDSQPGNTFWKVVVQLQIHMLAAQVLFQCLISGQSMVSTEVFYRSNEQPRTLAIDSSDHGSASRTSSDRLIVHPSRIDRRPNGSLMSSEPVNMRAYPHTKLNSGNTSGRSTLPSPGEEIFSMSSSADYLSQNSTASMSTLATETTSTSASEALPLGLKSQRGDKKRFFWKRGSRSLSNDSSDFSEAGVSRTNTRESRKSRFTFAARELGP